MSKTNYSRLGPKLVLINFTFELHFSPILLLLEVRQLKYVHNIFRANKSLPLKLLDIAKTKEREEKTNLTFLADTIMQFDLFG